MVWNPELDLELTRLRDGGLSFGKISKLMGVSRSAAIGRFQRLNGKLFPSQIARQKQINASKRLLAARREREQRLITKLKAEIAAGNRRNRAVKEAYEAGATVSAIGRALGVTPQRVQQIAAAQGAKRKMSKTHGSIIRAAALLRIANQLNLLIGRDLPADSYGRLNSRTKRNGPR